MLTDLLSQSSKARIPRVSKRWAEAGEERGTSKGLWKSAIRTDIRKVAFIYISCPRFKKHE